MNWHIGQRVVCVGSFTLRAACGEVIPWIGKIYTIRGIRGATYLLLDEIINPHRCYLNGVYEVAFNSDAFRPVVEPDISVFTAILDRLPKREVVDA